MPRLPFKRPWAGRKRGAKPTVDWTSVKAEQRCQGRRFDRGLGRRIFEESSSFLFVPSSLRRSPNPPQFINRHATMDDDGSEMSSRPDEREQVGVEDIRMCG